MSISDPKAPDPSMAEILASIRDILNEDEKEQPDEPLELTEAMLVPPPAAPAPVVVDLPPPGGQGTDAIRDALMAPATAAATAAALGQLARAVAGDRAAPVSRSGGASLEDVVRDEMRPLLKAWLDQHLPGMVERIVKAEIAKLMGPEAG